MGARGPKPGFKRQAVESAPAQEDGPVLSSADRENPNKLSGATLRELAHKRGIARSLVADMSDEKIREQLRYIVHAQYEEETA